MIKHRIFPTLNTALIVKHILAMRQGSFFITNYRLFIFQNFKIINITDDVSTNKVMKVINNQVKLERLKRAESYKSLC